MREHWITVVALIGSPRKHGNTDVMADEVLEGAKTACDLFPIPEGGVYLRPGGGVKAQVINREKSFMAGEALHLMPNDLAEMCWFVLSLSDHLVRAAVEFARGAGVAVIESSRSELHLMVEGAEA